MQTIPFTTKIDKTINIDTYGKVDRPLPAHLKTLGFDEFNVDQQISLTGGNLTIHWTLKVDSGKHGYEIYHKVDRVSGSLLFEGIDLERPFDEDAELVEFELEIDTENEKFKEWMIYQESEDVKVGSGVISPQSVEVDFNKKEISVNFER